MFIIMLAKTSRSNRTIPLLLEVNHKEMQRLPEKLPIWNIWSFLVFFRNSNPK